ncbi:MAG: hypothetical protein IJF14_03965 [Clostridia bacterium]|nr:hypothetical protein [Clostridia bacterium]
MSKRLSSHAVGICSLLVIFILLCLTVFALLSLSTAKAGERLSKLQTQAVKDYYQAEVEANHILAQLRNGNLPDGVEQEGEIYSYSCRISDTLNLYVEVKVTPSGSFDVLRWQSASSAEWTPDDRLPVWEGNK